MRWKGRRQSENVEDRRGMRPAMAVGGIGGAGALLILILALCMGADPRALFQALPQQGDPVAGPGAGAGEAISQEEAELEEFVKVVLADTEDVWKQLFQETGRAYKEPTLVMFRDRVQSACGFQSAAVGPFYCPLDQKVYIDLSFYDEMKNTLAAPGDFAQAYVIAHEIGHHVQNLMGISEKVQSLQQRASKEQANELSVRLELQADFFAGVWAHHAQQNWQILESGDVKEALNAANAIGDDRLQKQSQGYVVPDSFTHGTSEQRARWFFEGLRTGDIEKGDTFSMPYAQL